VEVPTRRRAIRILADGRAEIDALLAVLSPRDLTRPGIGGGTWSPKDLVGHLESWEEYALDALAAWDRGKRAPIDGQLYSRSTSAINAEGAERKRRRSYTQMRRHADATHARLVAAIEALSDERWREPATPRGRRPLGHRLGGILGGPGGLFMHSQAHVKSLRAFVTDSARGREGGSGA
jgi:hypothetical protein